MLEKYFHKIGINPQKVLQNLFHNEYHFDAQVTSKRLIRDEFLRKVTVFWLIVN